LIGLTGAPIFAGGDFAQNEGTVAAAIGSGRRAAFHIHRTLTGEDLFPEPSEAVAEPQLITMHAFTRSQRHTADVVPAVERRHEFREVRLGYHDQPGHHPAMLEAQRCMSCGVCNSCDRCRTHCPEGVLRRNGDEYEFDYDYCKGCGVCATQCPRGVVYMAEL
jgi:ferredoxin